MTAVADELVIGRLQAAPTGTLVIGLGTRVESTSQWPTTCQWASMQLKILFSRLVEWIIEKPALALELGFVR